MIYEIVAAAVITAVIAVVYLQRRHEAASPIPPGYRAGYSQDDGSGVILCAIYHPGTLDTLATGIGATEAEALADALRQIGGRA